MGPQTEGRGNILHKCFPHGSDQTYKVELHGKKCAQPTCASEQDVAIPCGDRGDPIIYQFS